MAAPAQWVEHGLLPGADLTKKGYTDTKTHRQTDRQKDRQRDRQTNRQRDRQADRQTHRHIDTQTHTDLSGTEPINATYTLTSPMLFQSSTESKSLTKMPQNNAAN